MALGANKRRVGHFPETVTLNLVAESAPSNQEKGVSLVGRPKVEDFAVCGDGPTRAVLSKAGVFNGDTLVVSGTNVYRVAASGNVTQLTGGIPGYGRVSIDSNAIAGISEARIATGTALYVADETTVAPEAFPDDLGVVSIAYLKSWAFALAAGTGKVYARGPADTSWDAITFTTAEAEPDPGVSLNVLGDYLVVFGSSSVEFFALTGEANPAAAPVEGLRADKGLRNRDTVVNLDNSLFFVGQDCVVYRLSTTPERVSDHGLEEQIRLISPAKLRAFPFTMDGHSYCVLRLGDEATYAYDAATKLWSRWSSYGFDYFRGHLGTDAGGVALVGDSNSGAVWRMSPDKATDAGEAVVREATFFIEIHEGAVDCDNFAVRCAVGHADQGETPKMSLKWSDDQGQTWGPWEEIGLGVIGDYSAPVIFWQLGTIYRPGRIFRVRVTDATTVRIDGADMNIDP